MALTQEQARQCLTFIRNGSLDDLEKVLRAFVDGDFNALAGVTASASELNKLDGSGDAVASGTAAANIATVATNLADDADGEAIADAVNANATAINAIIAAIEEFGIAAEA